MTLQARADGERHDQRPGAGPHQQRQLDLDGVLRQVGVVVGLEGRAKAGDAPAELAVHADVSERRPPRAGRPDPDARGPGLMVGAGQDYRRRRELAREPPAQGRHGTREDQARMRHERAHHGRGVQGIRARHLCRPGQKHLHELRQTVGLRRVEGPGHGHRPRRRPWRRRQPRRGRLRRRAHETAPDWSHSSSPTPAREWPQRAHRPPTSAARTDRNPRRRISVSPQSAQRVSSSPSARLPE